MQNWIAVAWAWGEMEKGANAVHEWLKEYEYSHCHDHEFHCVSPDGFVVSSLLNALSIMTGWCYHGVSESLAVRNI